MDEMKLAEMFIEYRKTEERLEGLRQLITKAVMELGESRKVAGVVATYYKPSREVDWESLAKDNGGMPGTDVFRSFTTTKESTKWKDICEYLKVTDKADSYSEEKPARVVVK